ncbi:hypothetical protein L0668_04555 [Paraglaciecola aquimarina]|uniref:MSHA biogenesis protein MshF n=1 Tax=Paraglaciecola algarum TaxID=3050085 RepID=A0ABS9D362_9ALTE|nr:hypothetical protein [Paraglaciecola sp. G1-23]MCF2947367.1 hypothetical protein [Paraglaciecola sp. G1-23]
MLKQQATEERNRSFFINIIVVMVFVGLMLGFILYLNNNSPDLRRLTLEKLAEGFNTSVHNAHWQWQAEGRPQIVMLVSYANKLGDDNKLVATQRRPIFMSYEGWPKSTQDSAGCEEIWNMVLDVPMEIDGFRVIAEYYQGEKLTGNMQDSVCRYRLSTGPYFEYKLRLGQVLKVKS